jgi:hypothetical protein
MTDDALQESIPSTPKTFATTTSGTKSHNTATVDPSVQATSNGSSGKTRKLGSTSKGKNNAAVSTRPLASSVMALFAVVSGSVLLLRFALR